MPSVSAIVQSGQNVDLTGEGSWADVSNVTADDGLYAQAGFSANGVITDGLRGRDPDFSTLPDTATITGIGVEVERMQTAAANVRDESLLLVVGGATTGDNKAVAGNWTSGGFGVATYGGAADLWGTGGLTPAQVKAGNDFGVQIQAARPSGSVSNARVEFFRITVHYTEDAPTDTTVWLSTGIGTPAERWVERFVEVSDGGRAGGGTTIWI